jgi:nitrate/TMAO reductase-like tetraheme cytochrome c subunit
MKPMLIFVLLIDIGIITFIIFQWKYMSRVMRRLVLAAMLVGYSVLGTLLIGGEVLHSMSEVKFCLRCHVMEAHGKTLQIDDNEVLSAVHYQNNYVPKATACFACHSDYGMFGTVAAKISGLRHMLVYYTGNSPDPKKLKTYSPYNVQNCLHCHAESKRFLAKKGHNKNPDMLNNILSAQKGCLVSGCHDIAHGVGIDRGGDEADTKVVPAAAPPAVAPGTSAPDAPATEPKKEESK